LLKDVGIASTTLPLALDPETLSKRATLNLGRAPQ